MADITLRDYQDDVIESILKTKERGISRQLVVMSTGLGKSYTIIQLLLRAVREGKRCLVLVDQKDLVQQAKENIHNMDDSIHVGIERAHKTAKLTDDIVIATVQTLGREGKKRIKKFPQDHFDVCWCDEAHKSIAETWFRTLEYFHFGKDSFKDDRLLVGCTATPFRNSGESLGILYDDIVANYDLRFAISEGWLVDFMLYEVSTNTDLSSFTSQTQFDEAVDNDERNLQALKAYNEIASGEKGLIYTASVDHAYHLAELFNQNGIPSAVIEANTPEEERSQILEDYKRGDIKCIMNFATMTTGVDVPETQFLMLLRKVQSKLLITQIIGRGLRPSQTAFVDAFNTAEKRKEAIKLSRKPTCKVIDMFDKVGNHNFAHVPSLFGLHNELKTKQPKRFYEEVVEPLEEVKKEHGIDPSTIKDLDDIDLLVKNRKVEIQSLKLDPKIEDFTDRKWMSVGDDSYEIIYSENNKALLIEADESKKNLLEKKEWNLLEHDLKDNYTKRLQTFNNISGAFKVADEYADRQGWNAQFKKRADWMKKGVTEKQLAMFNKFFKYKSGYSKFKLLNERYEDTEIRKIHWKPTGEVLDRGMAVALLDNFMNK